MRTVEVLSAELRQLDRSPRRLRSPASAGTEAMSAPVPYPYEKQEQPPFKRTIVVDGHEQVIFLPQCVCTSTRKGEPGGICQTCGRAIPAITKIPRNAVR